jgi:DNA-binding transcriptional LysR family regulator
MVVCEELHFTRAAEKLGISQPTLSQQIKLLEDRLETPLFHRIGKKVILSKAGEIVLEHAQRIFAELDSIQTEIKKLKGLERGSLTLGCSGNYLVQSAVLSFHEQYPNIKLSVIDTTTEETIDQVLNNKFDLGVVYLLFEHDMLESKRLFRSEFVLVVSVHHPLSKKSFVNLAELQTVPLFLLPQNYFIRQVIQAYCTETGIKLNPVVELSDLRSLVQLAVLNKGATILPDTYIQNLNEKRIKPIPILDDLPPIDVGIVYRKDQLKSNTVMQVFVEHLLENRQV